jgi:acetyl esterase/lipase
MNAPTHSLPPMEPVSRGRDDAGETPRPPYDVTTKAILDAIPFPVLTAETIVSNRAESVETAERLLEAFPALVHREVTIEGYEGSPLVLSIWRCQGDEAVGPGFVWIHGGGMVGGNRFSGLAEPFTWLESHGGTLVSAEYRLAPESPAPVPVEDCYAALAWVAGHGPELGLDASRIILAGSSAGGGLAAGVMLLARDRGTPPLLAVMLVCPMLDDRNTSTSIRQYDSVTVWNARANEVGWTALLGEARGTEAVSPYDAPARATWLGGLPPVHIGVGSADPFRDEDTDFARGIWRDGGDCELHVLPGGMHSFEAFGPGASIARSMMGARAEWVTRQLLPDSTEGVVEKILADRAALQASSR